MTFRDRLIATLRRLRPVLDEPGVLVVGSEVPNLLEPGAASTLVVSLDVDVAIPVERVGAFKEKLRLVTDLFPSEDEPSVFVPRSPDLIEANFLGLDRSIHEAAETYVLDDPDLPLMTFGPLGLLHPGPVVDVDGLRVPLPRPADLMVEKLLTDRAAEKGARDLLVVAGLLTTAGRETDELLRVIRRLSPESRHAVRSNLTILSLMESVPGMPDPAPLRPEIARLLVEIEREDAHE